MRIAIAAASVLLSVTGPASAATSIEAICADTPPAIDGRLDDACWTNAGPFTNFLAIGTTTPAALQSFGQVLYDDANLYIGVKCVEPDTKKIKAGRYPQDGPVYREDSIEIMIDPGATKTSFVQLIVNAAGSKFDALRTAGGGAEDDSWNGEWEAKGFIGEGFWSCEVKVPFSTLGVTAKTGPVWGLNVCRDKGEPAGNSSIADLGMYNDPAKFAQLMGLQVDFSKYAVRIGEPKFSPRIAGGRVEAVLTVPIANDSNAEQKVLLEKLPQKQSQPLALAAGQEQLVEIESLLARPATGRRAGAYAFATTQATQSIRIKDSEGRTTLAGRNLAAAETLEIIRVQLAGPAEGSSHDRSLEVTLEPAAQAVSGAKLAVTVEDVGGKKLLDETITTPGPKATIKLPAGKLPSGELRAKAALQTAKGQTIGEAAVSFVNVKSKLKRLNSLVTELVSIERDLTDGVADIKFENPRRGWVFLSLTALKGNAIASLGLDVGPFERRPPVLSDVQGDKPAETMRLLSAGEHTANLTARGRGKVRLVIRSVPELIFTKFGYNPRVTAYGPYDWAYLGKHVLDCFNTLVVLDADVQKTELAQWRGRGGRTLIEVGFPGLVNAPLGAVTADSAYSWWSQQSGFRNPLLDGVIVDEIGPGQPKDKLAAWGQAVVRLKQNFKDKVFYPYCYGVIPTDPYGREFIETAIDCGGKIAWERYLQELPTETEAARSVEASFKHELLAWEKAVPGCREHMIVTLGVLTSITAETESCHPEVDFKTYLDMQCHFLANDPSCEGLYGVQTYTSGYEDEEILRWASRLFRHYFIEGNRDPLSAKYGYKYRPECLQNGDFTDGAKGWTLKPAEEGAISVKTHPGYARMQGRMVAATGDNFLVTKRSTKAPNVVTQKAVNLVPGKLYSLKLVTGNYDELKAGKSTPARHPVSVTIDNVTMVPEKTFVQVQPNLYCYFVEPFSETNTFIFNFHRLVFRANSDSAAVTISDWKSGSDPGGPAGQQIMYSFAELLPYFDG